MIDGGDVREAEIQVQESRRQLEQAAAVWLRGKRDAAVSGKGLLAAVAAGFVVGGVLRGRKGARGQGPQQVAAAGGAAAAGGGVLGMVAGLAMTLLRMRYGDPLTAASALLLKRRSRVAQTGAPPPGPPARRGRVG
ncbi:hypothetical protein GPA19_04780 [Azoarcus indigens]|uniref:Uncharacterized protein n=1 Tax=Azoarcus indigens TaxID=29545 RepID=A0A4R6ECH3_9RHOO|nr:hypothetical protein [Azoarcus indigens]NMG64260.1 hypothetical protein [Azoarcus indigens]TDN55853.1 hypothetical protein C7389_103191 [Azoarcus indigens]